MAFIRGCIEECLVHKECADAFQGLRDRVVDGMIVEYVEKNVLGGRNPEQTLEIVFQVLGEEFVERNLKKMANSRQPHLIHPPYMLPDMKIALSQEFEQELVSHVIEKYAMIRDHEQSKHGLGQALAKLLAKMIDAKLARDSNLQGKAEIQGELLINAVLGTPYALPLADSTEKKLFMDDSPEILEELLFGGAQGVVMGQIAWDRVKTDDLERIFRAIRGKHLPGSLRRFLYRHQFYDSRLSKECAREIVRNQGTSTTGAVVSQINNLLTRLVNETFRTTFSEYDTVERRSWLLQILNSYFACYGEHHPSLMPIALVLHLDFEDTLAPMHCIVSILRNLVDKGLPGGSRRCECPQLAQKAWNELIRRDLELGTHLRTLYEQHRVNNERLQHPLRPHVDDAYGTFMSWFESGFAGFLRMDSVRFIWSQCIILSSTENETWEKIVRQVCVGIFILLREPMLELGSVSELERLLRREVPKVYTKDVREMIAFLHTC